MTLLEDPIALNEATRTWVEVCALDDVMYDRGVCALVAGRPVAVFLCAPVAPTYLPELYALSNVDPYSDASVLSRGIIGSVGDRPVVASPVYKQRFDLRTGEAVDDPAVRVPVHFVEVRGGRIFVSAEPATV